MKRTFAFLGMAALVAFTAGDASAGNPKCLDKDDLCIDTNDANAGSENPLVDVTSQLPWQGIVVAGQGADPTTDAYVYLDGDAGTAAMLPLPLEGYLGLHATDGPVYRDRGNFRRRGGNEPLDPEAFVTGLAGNLQEAGGGGGAPDAEALIRNVIDQWPDLGVGPSAPNPALITNALPLP